MEQQRPKFMDSEFFDGTPGAWKLKPGAPEEILREFTQFMAQLDQIQHRDDEFELVTIDPEED